MFKFTEPDKFYVYWEAQIWSCYVQLCMVTRLTTSLYITYIIWTGET